MFITISTAYGYRDTGRLQFERATVQVQKATEPKIEESLQRHPRRRERHTDRRWRRIGDQVALTAQAYTWARYSPGDILLPTGTAIPCRCCGHNHYYAIFSLECGS